MAVNGGKVLGSAASGAAMGTAIMPGWGTAIGGVGGALYGLFSGGDDNGAPAPPPSQYGGNPLTNQLAAQQYAEGLAQQQAQNAREAAFYNQANGNFDIANAAQMREGPQIASSLADKQRQLAALQGTNGAVGNVNQTGNQLSALGNQSSNQVTATGDRLTALGTRPMGPSYAEAQMHQGLDASLAQQLSMARSGRSLGSGAASMNQAMFNNAALNQQTNQAAASARIQEQNAYNQFQANTLGAAGQQYNANNQFQAAALGAAGQQYGAAGALSGQAGNQATGIRQGNEAVQLQNAQLQQSQQGINNQTTGLYNQLGSQQQNLGMQANTAAQNAYQFGAKEASGALGAQLNADTGRLSATTETNIANQKNANLHDAANANQLATAAGSIGMLTNSSGGGTGTDASSVPTDPNKAFGSITTASNAAGPAAAPQSNPNGQRLSDERMKTNLKPLVMPAAAKPGTIRTPSASDPNPNVSKYAEFSPEDAAAYRAADQAAASGKSTYTANGKTEVLRPYGDKPMDEDTRKMAVTDEGSSGPSYAETIAALNAGYAPSQRAPTDVLNHVAGAGAGHSASQDAVIARMTAQPRRPPPEATQAGGINAYAKAADYGLRDRAPLSGDQLNSLAHAGMLRPQAAAEPGGIPFQKIGLTGATRSPPPPPPAWGDVFNQPTLDPRIQAYLNGGSPVPAPVVSDAPPAYSSAPIYSGSKPQSEQAYMDGSGTLPTRPGFNNLPGIRSSDAHSKTRIQQLESQLAALQGPPSASFAPEQPDTAALDSSEYGRQVRQQPGWRDRDQLSGPSSYPHRWDADPFASRSPAVDLTAAQGYSYDYKDPHAPGAAPGRHVGPMAQDLEHTAAAGTVRDTPHGKVVDTPGLTMVNTAAISELQRKLQQLEALGGGQQAAPAYQAGLYPQTRAPY